MRLHMPQEILFASSYGVAKDLCDEQRFQKAVVGPLEEVRALGGDGLFTAHNGEHNWERTLVFCAKSQESKFVVLVRVQMFLRLALGASLRVELQLIMLQWLIDC